MLTEFTLVAGTGILRSPGVDSNLRRSPFPIDISPPQTRDLSDRSGWYERYKGASCQFAVQDLLALPRAAVRVGRDA